MRRQSSRNFLQIDTPDRNSCDVYRRCGPSAADPTILAQFSFTAVELPIDAPNAGVTWNYFPEINNAVPPPSGTGGFTTIEALGAGLASLTGLPGATECPLRIETFLNGVPFNSIDLEWREVDEAWGDLENPVPMQAVFQAGVTYTGLIRQLPCPKEQLVWGEGPLVYSFVAGVSGSGNIGFTSDGQFGSFDALPVGTTFSFFFQSTSNQLMSTLTTGAGIPPLTWPCGAGTCEYPHATLHFNSRLMDEFGRVLHEGESQQTGSNTIGVFTPQPVVAAGLMEVGKRYFIQIDAVPCCP